MCRRRRQEGKSEDMAFWNRWKKKQKEEVHPDMERQEELLQSSQSVPEGDTEVPESLEQEEVSKLHKADQLSFVKGCCDSIGESERQLENIKKEYEQVTEYLTDIQKIDRISGESRETMLDLCKKINRLLKERNQYKNRELTITDSQIHRFDLYQEELIDEIKKMYQAEAYQRAIEGDMKNLEKEKVYLRQEQKEIVEKQNALKAMAKVLAALIVSLIVLFVVIYYTMRVDMTYPYMGTLLIAAVSATVILVESNRNRQEMTLSERKMNKAIGLLNRTKIKYINNVSVLDYNCDKFRVKNAEEFEIMWGEYCKAKEYERKFKENTDQLNRSNEALVELLAEYQIADPEVWLIQTYAILDSREMVEIRHDLNQRRQKLREQAEYNNNTKKELMEKIRAVMKANPEKQQEILRIVKDMTKQS